MECDLQVIIPARIQFQFIVFDQVRCKFDYMGHLCGFCILKPGASNRRNRLFKEISGPVKGIHILIKDPPHVTTLTSQYPLHPQPLGLGVHLGIQSFRHLMGCEIAKVAPF